ncbi:MAG: ornithine carbamoyltransferase [Gammaproteobacteria bacterium]|nr:ornithine carbamoyltransferase [Gammaproteobacteria bacterium]
MKPRHFLTLADLTPADLRALLDRARVLKTEFGERRMQETLYGRVLAMIFEKSSTRTRVSFEAAMVHLGGHAIFLAPGDSQLVRGEPPEDTARVLSRMVDCILIRTHAHRRLEAFAGAAEVPVINGLSDLHHPCQLLADLQTFVEHRGEIRGSKVAWIGDGNNVCHSYIEAAALLGLRLHIASPEGFQPAAEILKKAGGEVILSGDPRQAVEGADLVLTDVWTSMGQEADAEARRIAFEGFQVNGALMRLAAPDALFMHCLPAHRGEEVTSEVIDGPQSVVWEEAGNRLHAQKALLEFLLR